jgi:aspartate ammonia-lyase
MISAARVESWGHVFLCHGGGCAAQSPSPSGQAKATATRTEHDLLGDKQIPADCVLRCAGAARHGELSALRRRDQSLPRLRGSGAIVKLAAARANTQVGAMKPERLAMIEKACKAVMDGKYSRPVSRRLVPGRRGHVDKHVRQRSARQRRPGDGRTQEGRVSVSSNPRRLCNMSQSTNDSYPTAIKVALILRNDKLSRSSSSSRHRSDEGREYLHIVKMGAPSCRTRCR